MEKAGLNPVAAGFLGAARIKDLRANRAIAPGGRDFSQLVRTFLPLVFGTASRLMAERPEAVEEIVLVVFRTFAFRWRRLPRRTVIAGWLLRSTGFAVARQRRRLRLPAPERASDAAVVQVLFRRLNRMRAVLRDIVVLRSMLRLNLEEISQAWRIKEPRLEKSLARGLARLDKKLRQQRSDLNAETLLSQMAPPVSAELELRVVSRMCEWSRKQKKDPRVRSLLRTWRWIGFQRGLRRCFLAIAASAGVLLATVAVMIWLAQHGYLTAWFLRLGSRQLVKEIPELAQPARPWPSTTEPAVPASPSPPEKSSELYGLTNLWVVRLSVTPDQWQALQPTQVAPVPHLMQSGDQIPLRNPQARRSGVAGVLGIEFNWAEGQMDFAGRVFSSVAIRYRGNGTYLNSLYGPKQSFKVDLNKFAKGQHLAGVRTLNFINAIPDNSYLHDALGEQLFRDLGAVAPRTAYAYLTLNAPGYFANQPLGLFVLIENIDADFALDRFGSKAVPIFKPVTRDLFQYLGSDWQDYAPIYDLKTRARPDELDRVIQFARLVTRADDAEFANQLSGFLDLEEFAAFLAGHVLLSSYDGFLANGQNFYLYLDPRNQRFGFIPWDQDHAWGEFGYVATADQREQASIWQPASYRNRFLERVLKVEAFRAAYRRALERAITELFTVHRLYAQIDQVAAVIRSAVAAESDFRFKRFEVAISTNWLSGPREGIPEGPKAPVHQIKRFIANRAKSVRDQLDGKAEGVLLLR